MEHAWIPSNKKINVKKYSKVSVATIPHHFRLRSNGHAINNIMQEYTYNPNFKINTPLSRKGI